MPAGRCPLHLSGAGHGEQWQTMSDRACPTIAITRRTPAGGLGPRRARRHGDWGIRCCLPNVRPADWFQAWHGGGRRAHFAPVSRRDSLARRGAPLPRGDVITGDRRPLGRAGASRPRCPEASPFAPQGAQILATGLTSIRLHNPQAIVALSLCSIDRQQLLSVANWEAVRVEMPASDLVVACYWISPSDRSATVVAYLFQSLS
jgi:hypothetical protein